jgi:hypothetical protein
VGEGKAVKIKRIYPYSMDIASSWDVAVLVVVSCSHEGITKKKRGKGNNMPRPWEDMAFYERL